MNRTPSVLALLATVTAAPAVLAQEQPTHWSYAAKFVCGFQRPLTSGGESPVKTGNYATEINIHNPHYQKVEIRKKVILLVDRSEPIGREPRQQEPRAFDGIVLAADGATMDDCNRLWELTNPGAVPPTPLPIFIGYLVLLSKEPLDVDAVYTAAAPGGVAGQLSRAISIDVERVEGKQVVIDPALFPGGLDILKPQQPAPTQQQ